MTLRASAAARIRGVLEPRLASLIAVDFEEIVDSLLISAAEAWQAQGFRSFDNQEVNCTVQLYRFAEELKPSNPRWDALRLFYEGQQLSPEMLAGLVSATTARRPDLTITLGENARARVECKRLGGSAYAREYVAEGMLRFITGAYVSNPGYMVAYVQSGPPAASVAAINAVVRSRLDDSHVLGDLLAPRVWLTTCRSSHAQPAGPLSVELRHYLIETR